MIDAMNLPTLIVLVLVAVAFIAVALTLIRRRRRCASGCTGCPFAGDCTRKNANPHAH